MTMTWNTCVPLYYYYNGHTLAAAQNFMNFISMSYVPTLINTLKGKVIQGVHTPQPHTHHRKIIKFFHHTEQFDLVCVGFVKQIIFNVAYFNL